MGVIFVALNTVVSNNHLAGILQYASICFSVLTGSSILYSENEFIITFLHYYIYYYISVKLLLTVLIITFYQESHQ